MPTEALYESQPFIIYSIFPHFATPSRTTVRLSLFTPHDRLVDKVPRLVAPTGESKLSSTSHGHNDHDQRNILQALGHDHPNA